MTIGQHKWFPNTDNPNSNPLYEAGNNTYLRSGHVLVGEEEAYPEAYEKFRFNAESDWDNWVEVQTPTSDTITCSAYGNGRFVAGGGLRKVLISEGGLSWSEHSIRTDFTYLDSVAFGNGVFVAGQRGSTSIRVSEDGVSWGDAITVPGVSAARKIKFIDGFFFAFANSSPPAYSEDGENWVTGVQPASAGSALGKLGDRLIYSTSTSSFINYSDDWINWTQVSFGGGFSPYDMTSFNDSMLCVGRVSGQTGFTTSVDGVTWSYRTLIPHSSGVSALGVFNGRVIVIGQNGEISTSPDLENWYSTGASVTMNPRSISHSRDTCIVTGEDGIIFVNTPEQLLGLRTEETLGDTAKYMRIK